MVATDRVAELLTDAYQLHAAALQQLEAGDTRDAAEKAWCATKRATDALILARSGEEPEKSSITTRELRRLALQDQAIEGLKPGYYTRQNVLHGECFYLGLCEPLEDTERQIRETVNYIRDVQALAAAP